MHDFYIGRSFACLIISRYEYGFEFILESSFNQLCNVAIKKKKPETVNRKLQLMLYFTTTTITTKLNLIAIDIS